MSNRDGVKKKVVVAGGGIAGLTFSVLLLTYASEYYDVIVLEKAEDFEDNSKSGFAIALTLNSLRILASLGFDLVKEGVGMPLNRIIVHHSSEPDKIFAYASGIFSDPTTIQWVERGPLQNLLLDRFYDLGGKIFFDSTVVDINTCPDGDLIAILSNGKSCVGTYIVGADGIHSRVRKYLYTTYPLSPNKAPSRCPFSRIKPFSYLCPIISFLMKLSGVKKPKDWEASPLPWTALYGITFPLPEYLLTGDETGGSYLGTMHWYLRSIPGAYSTYSLQDGRVFWVCYQRESITNGSYFTEAEAEATMRTYYDAPYCTTLPDDKGNLPAGDASMPSKKTLFEQITSLSVRFVKVRLHHTFFYEISNPEKTIVLIGDAAHAMNTFHGQGAGMGIEESLVLCNGLLRSAWAEKDPNALVPEEILGINYFEKLRLPRSEKVTNLGWWFGMALMGDWWVLRQVRDRVLKRVLRTPTPHQLKAQLEEGLKKGGGDESCGEKIGVKRSVLGKNWLYDHKVDLETEEEFWDCVEAASMVEQSGQP